MAELSDLLTTQPGTALLVTINWGDGNESAAMLSGGAGSFSVSGQHVFAQSGQATLRVNASDPNTGASASLQFTVDTQTKEYPLGQAPNGIALGPDGNLWVGEDAGVARVTPSGVVTQVATIRGGEMVVGSDNNLWFMSYQYLMRMTLAGVATEVPLATDARPWDLAAGPDGNIWAALNTTNYVASIGRITTAGVITEFPVPTASVLLEGICAGPDGAMWFTEYFGNKIGRITTAGVITEFPIPTPDSRPVTIASGPDGNLWFTEWNAQKIGRITPSGVITEFASPLNNLQEIAAGPDGRLWFTAYGTPFVGAITTAGVATTVAIPSGSDAFGIVAGPDQAIWYTQPTGKRVARLVP